TQSCPTRDRRMGLRHHGLVGMGFYTPYAVFMRCRSSPKPSGIWRSAPSSVSARTITNSSSTRLLTSGLDKTADFAPGSLFARNFGENFALGLEYYTDLGPLQNWLPFNEQQHNLYGVVDFKIGRFDVNAGVGYGLTPGSDRLMYKMIIGTDLNA